jgi:hypothetical protein
LESFLVRLAIVVLGAYADGRVEQNSLGKLDTSVVFDLETI